LEQIIQADAATGSLSSRTAFERNHTGAPSDTMRRVVIHSAGSYDKLRIESAPSPEPEPDEVVIEVRAIGVNYADCMVRMGLYASAKEFVGWPVTPGFEVSGVVKRCGARVSDLPVGTPVFAVTLFDGYATELRVKRHQVFRIPPKMGMEQAAGFITVFLTAAYAVHELAHPRPGNKVLVHSAAGGVGGCLVQLAKAAGCDVTGVVGASHKVTAVEQHGADHVIDKSTESLWQQAEAIAPSGFDVIFDANGVATLNDSYKHLRCGGKLVVYGFHTMIPRKGGRPNWVKLAVDYVRTPRFNPLSMTQDGRSVLAFNLSYMFDRTELLEESMGRLLDLLEQDVISAPPVTRYDFENVADAHRDIESGNTVGKLVLVV